MSASTAKELTSCVKILADGASQCVTTVANNDRLSVEYVALSIEYALRVSATPMTAAPDLSALRSAIRLTVRLIENMHATAPANWASHLHDFVCSLKASGLRDVTVMGALLSIVDEEMQQHRGTRIPSFFATERIDEMLERFDHDVLLLDSVSDRPNGRAVRVRRVTEFIEQHLHEPLTLERLAAVVGRHRVNLATEFRSETGITVHDYLTRVRIRRAADLLRQGYKIEPVILLVGYLSKKNFYRHFKEQMGMTPGAFKAGPSEGHHAGKRSRV
jgi:AraC-like DNA-binding protein